MFDLQLRMYLRTRAQLNISIKLNHLDLLARMTAERKAKAKNHFLFRMGTLATIHSNI